MCSLLAINNDCHLSHTVVWYYDNFVVSKYVPSSIGKNNMVKMYNMNLSRFTVSCEGAFNVTILHVYSTTV